VQCLILAGGEGSRMWPLTESMPKILLPAGSRPFLDHQLELLHKHGIRDVVLAIGRHGHLVRDYAGDGARFGLQIRYSDEGAQLLGTGGAIRIAAERGLLQEAFMVLYGDSFTPIEFGEIGDAFHQQQRQALMVVIHNDNRWDRSNVLITGNDLILYDKSGMHPRIAEMRHIDYGVGILTRRVIQEELPEGKSDLAALYRKLSLRGELGWYPVEQRFYEIGSKTGLADFEAYLELQELQRTGASV
jgi:NDP-sugar pyrophosphorylase family protein